MKPSGDKARIITSETLEEAAARSQAEREHIARLDSQVRPFVPNFRLRFAILGGLALVLIGIGVGLIEFARNSLRYEQAVAGWLDMRPAIAVVYAVVGAFMLAAVSLYFASVTPERKLPFADKKFGRVYVFVGVLFCLSAFQTTAGLTLKALPSSWLLKYPQFTHTSGMIQTGTILLILGAIIYIFKKKALIIYGITEVVMAMISNVALLSKLDLYQSSPSDMVKQLLPIFVFLYLLSKGIGNIIDGLNDLGEKRITAKATKDFEASGNQSSSPSPSVTTDSV